MASLADVGSRAIYLAGVAETALGEVHDETEYSMFAKAAMEALAEAGLGLDDVDGLFLNYMGEEGTVQVGEYLGLRDVRYLDSTDSGGSAFELFVHHAMLAVAQGRCEVALIGFASRQRSRRQRTMADLAARDTYTLGAQFQAPYGLPMPIGHYAMMAARHMHQYGTTGEQLAEIAVAANQWAQLNPKAWRYGEPIEIDDVLESAMICDPLHKLDCCLVTDGGGAIVLTGGDRAKDAAKTPIRVLGAGESQTHWHIAQMPDATVTAAQISGREAFGMAGVTPADVDVFEPYDSFTFTVLKALEDLGFCQQGEGGAFVEKGALRPGGELPSMTSGGGLSYNHPGALGALLLVEAVRQLRGEAGDRQVEGARIAVAHGVGGFMSTAGTVVMARE